MSSEEKIKMETKIKTKNIFGLNGVRREYPDFQQWK